ncbi:MAG TPA: 30S ribosomal protein S6 [Solirubrobacteraceae bacterium]
MPATIPTYDLMLLLDPKAEDRIREKIRTDVRTMIEGAGTVVGSQEYGARKLAFEIDHATEAEYDLVQFEGPKELLQQLQRTLSITDGVTRFRIIKVRPGTPAAPDLRQATTSAAEAEAQESSDSREHSRDRD